MCDSHSELDKNSQVSTSNSLCFLLLWHQMEGQVIRSQHSWRRLCFNFTVELRVTLTHRHFLCLPNSWQDILIYWFSSYWFPVETECLEGEEGIPVTKHTRETKGTREQRQLEKENSLCLCIPASQFDELRVVRERAKKHRHSFIASNCSVSLHFRLNGFFTHKSDAKSRVSIQVEDGIKSRKGICKKGFTECSRENVYTTELYCKKRRLQIQR